MSILNTFDRDSEEILKPTNINQKIDGFPKTVLVSFSQRMVDTILFSNDHEIIGYAYAGISIPIYKVKYRENEIALYLSWVGAPATVGLMEDVIAKGGEQFLVFGSCGTLDKDITEGRIIIPTWAYRDEGTSYHYMSASDGDYVEVKSALRLATIMSEISIPYICGKTWTTDAFYRETRNNMEKRKAEGCISVEMECASVMAMAQFRGINAYQFLYSADNLDSVEWDARILGNLPDSTREKVARIACEVAVQI